MEFNDVINNRRSIRKYKSDPVSDQQLREILEAGRLAPSGLNLQPWRYIIIKDIAVKKWVSEATPAAFIAQAPIVIVCCMDIKAFENLSARAKELHEVGAFSGTAYDTGHGDDFFDTENMNEYWVKANLSLNTAVSIEHMVLKATDLGLGTCWIGEFDQEKIKGIIQMEDNLSIVALLPIGYADQEVKQRPRLLLEQIIVKEI